MVVAAWRRLASAARWNGQAPHTTTGAARVSESHCQPSNCSAGTIAIAMTGTVSSAETSSRWRRPSSSGSPASAVLVAPRVRRLRAASAAYPAAATVAEQVVDR